MQKNPSHWFILLYILCGKKFIYRLKLVRWLFSNGAKIFSFFTTLLKRNYFYVVLMWIYFFLEHPHLYNLLLKVVEWAYNRSFSFVACEGGSIVPGGTGLSFGGEGTSMNNLMAGHVPTDNPVAAPGEIAGQGPAEVEQAAGDAELQAALLTKRENVKGEVLTLLRRFSKIEPKFTFVNQVNEDLQIDRSVRSSLGDFWVSKNLR